MRRSRSGAGWTVLLLVVAGAACEVSSSGPRDRPQGTDGMMANDEAESISRHMREQVTALVQSGAAAATGLPALYAPDAVLSDETETTHSGNARIARAYAHAMPPGASIDIRSEGVIGSGDLVVDMGHYTFSMPGPQGTPTRVNGRYLVVLQRMADDSWKIVRELTDAVGMGGALPPGPPPADTAPTTRDSASAPTTHDSASAPPRAESGFTADP